MSTLTLRRLYGTGFTPWFINRSKRVAAVNSIRRMRWFSAQGRVPVQTAPIYRRSFPLLAFEDRRLWNPEGDIAPARSFSTTRHRLRAVLSPSIQVRDRYEDRSYRPVPWLIGFRNPSRVLVCVRRKQRREVLFALGQGGKNGQSSHRLSEYSDIHC